MDNLVWEKRLGTECSTPASFGLDGGIHRVNAAHRVDTVQISKWEEVNEVMQSPEIADYATFVIDTAGKMLSFMDKYIMQNNPKMRKRTARFLFKATGCGRTCLSTLSIRFP